MIKIRVLVFKSSRLELPSDPQLGGSAPTGPARLPQRDEGFAGMGGGAWGEAQTAWAGRVRCARDLGARGQFSPPHSKALEAWAEDSPGEKVLAPPVCALRQVTSPPAPLS